MAWFIRSAYGKYCTAYDGHAYRLAIMQQNNPNTVFSQPDLVNLRNELFRLISGSKQSHSAIQLEYDRLNDVLSKIQSEIGEFSI